MEKSRFTVSSAVMPLAKRWWLVAFLIIVLTVFFDRAIPRVEIDNDLTTMLPEDNQAKRAFFDSEEIFGNSAGIVLAIETREGLYQPAFLNRIKLLCDRLRETNIRILARQLTDLLQLKEDTQTSLVLAAYLQSKTGETDFDLRRFQEAVADPEAFQESLEDALPAFIHDDTGSACETAAEILCGAVEKNPALGERIYGLVHQTTDRRKHYQNLWVDQVVSLTETDTVWPEFTDLKELHAFADSLGIPVTVQLDYFLSDILENGLQDGSAVLNRLATGSRELTLAGISPSFQALLKERLNPERARELVQRVRSAPKQIRVGTLVQFSEKGDPTDRDRYLLKLRLNAWDFFREGLFSIDERNTLVLIRTAPNLDRENRALLLSEINTTLTQLFGDTPYRLYQAGEPVVDEAVGELMLRDVGRLLPVVTLVVMAFLLLSFRNLPGVAYPLLTVLLSLVWCVGTMAYAHVPISIVSTVLPVLLVAVGSAYGIHLIHHFQNEAVGRADPRTAGKYTLDVVGSGVFMAGLTTMAGFGSLGFNRIVPLRDFGIFIGVGVFYALMLSLYMVMALLMRFGGRAKRARKPAEAKPKTTFAVRILESLGRVCTRRPGTLILVYGVATALSLWGALHLKVEMNNISFFKPEAPVRVADNHINKHFAGTMGMRIIFDGPSDHAVLAPDVLDAVAQLSDHIKKGHPEVGKCSPWSIYQKDEPDILL